MHTPSTTPAAETPVPILAEYIVKTPGTCGGQARIAGTRIKVKHVYTWVEQMGMTPAQVVAEHPHLSRAAVHAALAYYWSHPDEIHKDIADEDELVARLQAESGPSKLQERLAQRRGDDSVPPG
jgi:uncharacterized protein (DUF433 family)